MTLLSDPPQGCLWTVWLQLWMPSAWTEFSGSKINSTKEWPLSTAGQLHWMSESKIDVLFVCFCIYLFLSIAWCSHSGEIWRCSCSGQSGFDWVFALRAQGWRSSTSVNSCHGWGCVCLTLFDTRWYIFGGHGNIVRRYKFFNPLGFCDTLYTVVTIALAFLGV